MWDIPITRPDAAGQTTEHRRSTNLAIETAAAPAHRDDDVICGHRHLGNHQHRGWHHRALFQWRYGWIPVVLGMAGACALLYGSLLLVREACLAVGSTMHELTFVRDAVSEGPEKQG